MTQGKGTTGGDLSSSLKKIDAPAAKKKAAAATAAADVGDAESVTSGTARSKPVLGGAPKGGGGPKIYTCYMCGQGFSGSSLGIHQPKCQQKWLAEQAAKPAGEFLMSQYSQLLSHSRTRIDITGLCQLMPKASIIMVSSPMDDAKHTQTALSRLAFSPCLYHHHCNFAVRT